MKNRIVAFILRIQLAYNNVTSCPVHKYEKANKLILAYYSLDEEEDKVGLFYKASCTCCACLLPSAN